MRFKKSDYILLIILLICIISYIEIKYFSYKSEPVLLDYSSNQITNIINEIINKSISSKIYNYKYNNIITIDKDDNGLISSVDFNNEIINYLLYIVSDDILNNIKTLDESNYNEIKYISKKDNIYYVPYGVKYNNSIFSNLGPKIPFKISLIGNVNNDTKINIEEYGINSSKIEVVLIINIEVQVILPFKSKSISVNKSIILDSKIVQGKVPDYYGGLYSVN